MVVLTIKNLYAKDQQRVEQVGGKIARINTDMQIPTKGASLVYSTLATLIVLPHSARFYKIDQEILPYEYDYFSEKQQADACRDYNQMYLIEIEGNFFFYADAPNKQNAVFHSDFCNLHKKSSWQSQEIVIADSDELEVFPLDMTGYSDDPPQIVDLDDDD
jgi:hypothetical protein